MVQVLVLMSSPRKMEIPIDLQMPLLKESKKMVIPQKRSTSTIKISNLV